jgi:hypothetical protein
MSTLLLIWLVVEQIVADLAGWLMSTLFLKLIWELFNWLELEAFLSDLAGPLAISHASQNFLLIMCTYYCCIGLLYL